MALVQGLSYNCSQKMAGVGVISKTSLHSGLVSGLGKGWVFSGMSRSTWPLQQGLQQGLSIRIARLLTCWLRALVVSVAGRKEMGAAQCLLGPGLGGDMVRSETLRPHTRGEFHVTTLREKCQRVCSHVSIYCKKTHQRGPWGPGMEICLPNGFWEPEDPEKGPGQMWVPVGHVLLGLQTACPLEESWNRAL